MHIAALITASIDPHLFLRHRPPCNTRLACDLQAFTLPEFRDPLLFGFVAVGAGAVVSWGRRAVRGARGIKSSLPVPIAGLLFAAAALAGYQRTGHLVPGFALSIALLLTGGLIGDIASLPAVPRMLLSAPGAVVLATESALPDPLWARVFAGAITVVGAGLIDSLDRRCCRLGLGPLLLAVTTVGLYETVPDPDFALLLVGAALPMALLGWPIPLARLGGAGAAAAAGFLAWADAVGGRGRLGTVVAGGVCLGLFAIEPPVHWLLRDGQTVVERLAPHLRTPVVVSFIQLALAAACTRIALDNRTPVEAGEIAGIALLLAIIATYALSQRRIHLTARLWRADR
ncbi:MAG TPA: hypothetical protein VFZ97_06345 [Acidimicrobiales bacterium]